MSEKFGALSLNEQKLQKMAMGALKEAMNDLKARFDVLNAVLPQESKKVKKGQTTSERFQDIQLDLTIRSPATRSSKCAFSFATALAHSVANWWIWPRKRKPAAVASILHQPTNCLFATIAIAPRHEA